jgi:hypothetical protein
LELIPTSDIGKNVLEIEGKVYHYEGNISDLSLFSNLDGEKEPEIDTIWNKIEELSKTVNLENFHETKNAEEYDKITAEEWIVKNSKYETTRILVRWFISVCITQDPSGI